jgi:hypothetical protein
LAIAAVFLVLPAVCFGMQVSKGRRRHESLFAHALHCLTAAQRAQRYIIFARCPPGARTPTLPAPIGHNSIIKTYKMYFPTITCASKACLEEKNRSLPTFAELNSRLKRRVSTAMKDRIEL